MQVRERPGRRPRQEPRPPDDDRERPRVLRRDPRGDDPDHRDQRRDHRGVAADLLDGAAQTVTRGAAAHPPALLHAVRRDRALQRRRGRAHARELDVPRATCTRSGRCSRSRSPTPRWSGCGTRCRRADMPYRGPLSFVVRGYDVPLFAVLGGLATFIFWLVTIGKHFSDNVAPVGPGVARDRDGRLRDLPAHPGPAADGDGRRAGRRVRPGRRGRVPLDPPAAHVAHGHRRDDRHGAPAGGRVGHEAHRALSDPGAAQPIAGRPDGRRRRSAPSTSCERRRRSGASTA